MGAMNLLVAGVVTILALVACGPQGEAVGSGASGVQSGTAAPVAGMCAQDQPDCVDTPQLNETEPVPIDETGVAQLRKDARFYLGKGQDDLNELIRVGRIGDEHMALTEDYRVGRITVELDDVNGDGELIVTSATVELPDGPETFTLEE